MKKIIFLHLDSCPYCHNALKAMKELAAENADYAKIDVEKIEESKNPEAAKPFANDYYYVPTMFIDGKKMYEAHPGESYDECRAQVAKVFAAACE